MESTGHIYSFEILPLKCQHDINMPQGKQLPSVVFIPFFPLSARAPQPINPSLAQRALPSFEACFKCCRRRRQCLWKGPCDFLDYTFILLQITVYLAGCPSNIGGENFF